MSEAIAKAMSDMDEYLRENRIQGDIEFPVEVSKIESRGGIARGSKEVGSWVSIRPCSDDKTYLGVYLGDMTADFFHSYNIKTKVLSVIPHGNPAIYVPDLKRVVWGCESWWGIIDTPEKLRKITNSDIENVWYVKALKELSAAPPDSTAPPKGSDSL